MKNYFVLLVTMFSMFLVACNKDESSLINENIKIEDQSFEAQKEYTKQHLLEIGKIVSKLYNNENFKLALKNDLNTKSNDIETILLVKDLIDTKNSKFNNLITTEDRNKLNEQIDAFKDIEGIDWQPQLYFPFSKNAQKIIDNSKPIFIPLVVEEEDETYEGFQEDGYGELISIDEEISKEFAEEYGNIIVLSLNEDIYEETTDDDLISQTNTPNSPILVWRDYQIQKMIVKSHKESWAAGASEVSIRSWKFFYNGECVVNGNYGQTSDCGYPTPNSTSSYQGKLIRKFSRDEVDNETEKTINYYLGQLCCNSDFAFEEPVILQPTIFESDAWPTGLREAKFPIVSNNTTKKRKFRSSHSEYSSESLYSAMGDYNGVSYYGFDLNYYLQDDNSIKFNTQYFQKN